MENLSKKAIIAMSGGVDSSVSALLTQNQGFDCVGITMRLIDNLNLPVTESKCFSENDIKDAAKVCETLGIPHYVCNFSSGFKEKVIDKFVSDYENGRTPNPCIECNRHIKFELLFDEAEKFGNVRVVTGHYADIEFDKESGRYLLKKASDLTKDQSYVLYSLNQKQLSVTYFPLGRLDKTTVREIAKENGFINSDKKDSQDICFIKNCSYSDFIENYTGKKYPCGNFVDKNGNVLGQHKGIIKYTVGQRKKLGLVLPCPMFVCAVNPETNCVVLGTEEELFSRELVADNINLISVSAIPGPMRVKAKIRYKQNEEPATVEQISDNKIRVVFDKPVRAITKGQSVVLYDGEYVIGGGTIC